MMIKIFVSLGVFWFFFKKTFVIIHTRHHGIRERLGKFAQVMKPGLHILVPFVDKLAYLHDMREKVLEIPLQRCITKDNIQVEVDGLVYLKVMDPQQASYGIENYKRASINLAQTTMRAEIGKLSLHDSFSEREHLNRAVVAAIDRASLSWGIKVLRYEIMNIRPSEGMIHALERAMEAERERRAGVTLAEAQRESVALISKAKKQEAILRSEGKKKSLENEACGEAEARKILARATSESLAMVAQSFQQPGVQDAATLKLQENFLTSFETLLKKSKIMVYPSDLGVFAPMLKKIMASS